MTGAAFWIGFAALLLTLLFRHDGLVENLGYRQLNTTWRLIGLWRCGGRSNALHGRRRGRARWRPLPRLVEDFGAWNGVGGMVVHKLQ